MSKMNKWQRKDWKRRVVVDRTSEMRTRLLSVLNEFEGKGVSSNELSKLIGDIDLKSVKSVSSKDNAKAGKSDVTNDVNNLNDIGVLLNRLVSLFPRDGSVVRVKNRCIATGTATSVMRKFRMSRFRVREMALNGMRPGYRKASW